MIEDIFSIDTFNIIQDEENYYFFRALNRGDNNDIENGIVVDESGEYIRIRTDRERWEEDPEKKAPRYTQDAQITLEEVNDHIKMHQRKDTNCISLSSNANVSIVYGRGYYADKYIMVKVPKKEMGQKVVNAGEYMLEEIERRVNEAITNITDPEVLAALNQIDNARAEEEIKEIIETKYQLKETYKRPTKRREKIALATPHTIVSSYQALSEEQSLEKNKIIGKLTLLERKGLMEPLIPNTSKNTSLIRTVGSAFSSLELIHYGDIEKEEMVEVPKEVMDIFALLQQVTESKEIVQEIEKEVIGFIMSGKTIEIPTTLFSDAKNKKDISIEEMYEITGGKVSYGKANSAITKMFYLSKSRLKAKELAKFLTEITSNNPAYQEVIRKIEEIGFSIEPEIVTRQNNRGYQLSESVNLDLTPEEEKIIPEIQNLSQESLLRIYQSNGAINMQEIFAKMYQEDYATEVTKERYIAEALIDSFDWSSIGVGEFTSTQRNELISKFENNYAGQIYSLLGQIQTEKNEIMPLIFAIVSLMEHQRKKSDMEFSKEKILNFIKENKDELNTNITIERVERLLGYYDVENTGIVLRDFQQIAVDNADEIFEDKRFAAIILPTGTGKTFVTLAELIKHKDEKILYLAPSYEILEQVKAYIVEYVHGNKETLGKSTDEIVREVFPNLQFAIYANLNGKDGKEMIENKYDFIVLDELHRTGAESWGKKLEKLLKNQDETVKVLGITATPVRSRERSGIEENKRRNMADEIALKMGYTKEEIEEGKHIASEMTLEDAIRLGIVVNPKVVWCEYLLDEDGSMTNLLDKINNITNEKERNEAIEKYNELRRKLDGNVKGKKEILEEHIEEGERYIIFIPVSGKIKGKAAKKKIEEAEKYYRSVFPDAEYYSMLGEYDKKDNMKALGNFENSKTNKPKFMIVIDKLNEGIHVKGIKGIIWERPLDEDSTILASQQLGRVIYSLDPNEEEKDEDRPIVIDLANNLLKVRMNERINTYTSRDDLIILKDIVDWIKYHNDHIPDINSLNRQEERYATSLARIQKKYEAYLDGIDKEIEEEERVRIEKIISTGKEIDLWNIELPEKENKENKVKKEDYLSVFAITGVMSDYYELEKEIENKTALQRLIEVLLVLQANGVDLKKGSIKQSNTIKEVLNSQKISKEVQEKIEKEIKVENDLEWPIGARINNQKRDKNREKFSKRLKEVGLPEELAEEKDATEELIEVMLILQANGVELRKRSIQSNDTIKDVLNSQKISKEVQEKIEKEIKVQNELEWPIGDRIVRQKNATNREKFREALKEAGLPEELAEAKDATEELIEVMLILQANGVELKKGSIKQSNTIRDVLNSQKISKEVQEKIEKEIKVQNELEWPIGKRTDAQKSRRSREKFIQRLKEEGLPEDLAEVEKRAKDATEELIEVMLILQANGVELTKGSIKQSNTIKDVLNSQKISKEVQEKIEKEIKVEKGLNWPIGDRINTQKNATNREKFSKRLKEVGLPEELAELAEVKDATEELIEVMLILQANGVELTKGSIKQRNTIRDVLNSQKISKEVQEKIEKEIKVQNELEWPIGKRIAEQKSRRSREKFRKALKEAGLPEELADLIKETTAQDVGQAGFTASVDDCDAVGRAIVKLQERQMIY